MASNLPFEDQPTIDSPIPQPAAELASLYEILGELGRGGMGIVYRARDRETRDIIAIKILKPEIAANPVAVEQFKAELRLSRQITHPNVCRIHEFRRVGNTAFITMEAVEGESLREFLWRRTSIPWSEAVDIVFALCDGLAAAHARNITHRDLKPENVMINSAGQVKLMDFGLANVAVDDAAPTQTIRGTPMYMAPEQAQGVRVDHRADIYSLGLILYELVMGEPAFHAKTSVGMMLRQMHDDPKSLRDTVPTLPAPFESIVLKCLQKEPVKRFQSIDELRRELRQLTPANSRLALWAKLAVAGLIVAAAGAAAAGLLLRRNDITGPQTLVVLPCDEQSTAGDDRALCEGLVDTLAARLGNVKGLAVIPAREVHARKVQTARAAREDLGANVVLNTSWQRAGREARINLTVLDSGTGASLRTSTVTASVDDLFTLQDQVVAGAEQLLNVRSSATSVRSTNSPAYDYYLRGRGNLIDYDKPENLSSALALFKASLEKDPKFALAYAGLGETYYLQNDLSREPALLNASQSACEQAVALDGSLPEGHTCLGLALNSKGDYERAVGEFQTALIKAPNNDAAYRGLGFSYGQLHRPADAAAAYRKAIAERPGYWAGYNWLGVFYIDQSCYADANDTFTEMLRLAPDNYRGYSNQGVALNHLGRYEDAARAFQKSLAIRPSDAAFNNLGLAHYTLRRYAEAEENFQQAVLLGPRRYQAWGNLGHTRMMSENHKPQAAAAYRQAITLAEAELQTNPRNPLLLARLARYYVGLGNRVDGVKLMQRAIDTGGTDPSVLTSVALAKMQLGDKDGAIEYSALALKAGSPLSDIRDAPEFAPLRGDARFRKVLQAVAPAQCKK